MCLRRFLCCFSTLFLYCSKLSEMQCFLTLCHLRMSLPFSLSLFGEQWVWSLQMQLCVGFQMLFCFFTTYVCDFFNFKHIILLFITSFCLYLRMFLGEMFFFCKQKAIVYCFCLTNDTMCGRIRAFSTRNLVILS